MFARVVHANEISPFAAGLGGICIFAIFVLVYSVCPSGRIRRLLARSDRAWLRGQHDQALAFMREAELRWSDLAHNLDYQMVVAWRSGEAGQGAEAMQRYRALVETVPSSDPKFAEVADGFGTMALVLDRVNSYAEAEMVIRRAMEAFPERETLLGTLGGLLIEQGRVEEGRVLTEFHYHKKLSECDTAISAAFLAKLAAMRGDLMEAERYAVEARKLLGSHLLVKRLLGGLHAPN